MDTTYVYYNLRERTLRHNTLLYAKISTLFSLRNHKLRETFYVK